MSAGTVVANGAPLRVLGIAEARSLAFYAAAIEAAMRDNGDPNPLLRSLLRDCRAMAGWRSTSPAPTGTVSRRLSVDDVAEALGVTAQAVRKRAVSLDGEKDSDGRWWFPVAAATGGATRSEPCSTGDDDDASTMVA